MVFTKLVKWVPFVNCNNSPLHTIDLVSLYVLFSHLRPRYGTPDNCFFQMSSYACLCPPAYVCIIYKKTNSLGRVARRPVSANPGLNFNPGYFFFSSKAFSQKIYCILFRVFNHKIVENRIKLNLHFKLSYLNSNFVLTLGNVNPALNNPALENITWSALGKQNTRAVRVYCHITMFQAF